MYNMINIMNTAVCFVFFIYKYLFETLLSIILCIYAEVALLDHVAILCLIL